MSALLLATVCFLLIHLGVAGTRARDALVARMGEGPYRGAFSLASVGGLAWMGAAYAHAPTLGLWVAPAGLRPLVYATVFVGVLLVVLGLATPNPTAVGMEARLEQGPAAAQGVTRITRHPFLWGVALWALAHLAANGDLASLILFGSLLLLAVGGTVSIDAKRRRRYGAPWQAFAAVTSGIPGAAILAGRNRLAPALREIGLVRPAIAVAVYAALFLLHGRFIAPLL